MSIKPGPAISVTGPCGAAPHLPGDDATTGKQASHRAGLAGTARSAAKSGQRPEAAADKTARRRAASPASGAEGTRAPRNLPTQPAADGARLLPDGGTHRIVLVTGPSGAGRSTAINALEDLGFEAIDNLPLSLMPRLLDGPPLGRPLALGVDARNRDFSARAMIETLELLAHDPAVQMQLLYLDCSAAALLRRFSETRRRHPLAPAEAPQEGIRREFDLLGPIRGRADVLIDTTELTPHDLRAEIGRWFALDGQQRLAVSVQSFSYKRGVPNGVDLVFDCRFLRNPHWDDTLRPKDGRDPAVARHVEADALFDGFYTRIADLVSFLLPAYQAEGKSHLSIGFGCTGGRHRSVAVAEKLANTLADQEWQVSIRHREIEGRAGGATVENKGG